MDTESKIISAIESLIEDKAEMTVESIAVKYEKLHNEYKPTTRKIRETLYYEDYRSLIYTNSPTWNGKVYFHKTDVIEFLEKELDEINENYPNFHLISAVEYELNQLLYFFNISTIKIFLCEAQNIDDKYDCHVFSKMKINFYDSTYKSMIRDIIKSYKVSSTSILLKNTLIELYGTRKNLKLIRKKLYKSSLDWFSIEENSFNTNIKFNINFSFEKFIDENYPYSTLRERFVDFLEEKYPIEKKK